MYFYFVGMLSRGNEDTHYTSLCEGAERSPQRRDATALVQMTFRRLNLYNRHSLSLQSAMQQKGCVFYVCLSEKTIRPRHF